MSSLPVTLESHSPHCCHRDTSEERSNERHDAYGGECADLLQPRRRQKDGQLRAAVSTGSRSRIRGHCVPQGEARMAQGRRIIRLNATTVLSAASLLRAEGVSAPLPP